MGDAEKPYGADAYLAHAVLLRELAAAIESAVARQELLTMAEAYERLAQNYPRRAPPVHSELESLEKDLRKGEEQVSRQREIITKLERDGHDSSKAKEVLRVLNETQSMRLAQLRPLRQDRAVDSNANAPTPESDGSGPVG